MVMTTPTHLVVQTADPSYTIGKVRSSGDPKEYKRQSPVNGYAYSNHYTSSLYRAVQRNFFTQEKGNGPVSLRFSCPAGCPRSRSNQKQEAIWCASYTNLSEVVVRASELKVSALLVADLVLTEVLGPLLGLAADVPEFDVHCIFSRIPTCSSDSPRMCLKG